MRSLVEQNVTCRLSSALEQRSGSRQDAIPLGPPAFFGAQCIYGESVRARTVSAVTPAELLEVKPTPATQHKRTRLKAGRKVCSSEYDYF